MRRSRDAVDLKEAQLLFEAGALNAAEAAKAPLRDSGWILLLWQDKRSEPLQLAAQRDDLRLFKSADAVISTARKIGFRSIKFQF